MRIISRDFRRSQNRRSIAEIETIGGAFLSSPAALKYPERDLTRQKVSKDLLAEESSGTGESHPCTHRA